MEGRGMHCQAPKYSLLLKFYLNCLAKISSAASPLSWSSAQTGYKLWVWFT